MITPAWTAFVRLWLACRDPNGGVRNWPDPGGVADQSGWVMDGFSILARAEAKLEKLEAGED